MVAARMPEMMMPAAMISKTPWRLIRSAIWIMMVSESELVVKKGTFPAAETL